MLNSDPGTVTREIKPEVGQKDTVNTVASMAVYRGSI